MKTSVIQHVTITTSAEALLQRTIVTLLQQVEWTTEDIYTYYNTCKTLQANMAASCNATQRNLYFDIVTLLKEAHVKRASTLYNNKTTFQNVVVRNEHTSLTSLLS